MGKVHLVQWLCPHRHCLLAGAYEEGVGTFDGVVEFLQLSARKMNLNPWCAICGSRELRYEDAPTRWATLIEAAPHLGEIAAANADTRAFLDALGLTFDAEQRKHRN